MPLSKQIQDSLKAGCFVYIHSGRWLSIRQWLVAKVTKKYFWARQPIGGGTFMSKAIKFSINGGVEPRGRGRYADCYTPWDSVEAYQEHLEQEAKRRGFL